MGDGYEYALFSVFDKTGMIPFATGLKDAGLHLLASGGTALQLKNAGLRVMEISNITGAAEMLGGRVKTLHPVIHAGILARGTQADLDEVASHGVEITRIVVCNLYPFAATIADPTKTPEEIVEMIDIGGVAMIRAAAKNHFRVTVVCDPEDYGCVLAEIKALGDTSLETRRTLALKAFTMTAEYDAVIANHYRKKYMSPDMQLGLRYGINPHQAPAQAYVQFGEMPFKVLNGSPGYINLMDALNAWQLARELSEATDLPAACSFKHVSPAGAGVGVPLNDVTAKACMVGDLLELMTPLATAYARARGCDRMSSFGDCIALSDCCDDITARIIGREVSDAIIAPGYSASALAILKKKKGGAYCILKVDDTYEPQEMETRMIFGVTLEQKRNNKKITPIHFDRLVSGRKTLPPAGLRDITIATIVAKYTQSNSVVYAKDGQTIGIGAGQQSRIHCTRLAGDKADNWWMRHQPCINDLKFEAGVNRAQMANIIDGIIARSIPEMLAGAHIPGIDYTHSVSLPSTEERAEWQSRLTDVALASDAFFPFPDSIVRAAKSGVNFIGVPAGSANDEIVVRACDDHNIILAHTPSRLFHH